jgi:hypothetical protein
VEVAALESKEDVKTTGEIGPGAGSPPETQGKLISAAGGGTDTDPAAEGDKCSQLSTGAKSGNKIGGATHPSKDALLSAPAQIKEGRSGAPSEASGVFLELPTKSGSAECCLADAWRSVAPVNERAELWRELRRLEEVRLRGSSEFQDMLTEIERRLSEAMAVQELKRADSQ